MAHVEFAGSLHRAGQRDYLARVNNDDKAACSEVARRYGAEYWDGQRRYGYGGYHYDGRWSGVAKQMIECFGLSGGDRILDVGCGKGFLLHEFKQLIPELVVQGIDVSQYALENSKEEVRGDLCQGSASDLPFEDASFDLVISLGTLHNLEIFDLSQALSEISRVQRKPEAGYLMVESFRNEAERANLLHWQLTCESFYSVAAWEWLFEQYGYRGDYEFIYFA